MQKTMQSSPPLGRDHGQTSPVRSEYSLDLDSLDLDGQSDVTESLPKQQIDRIHSEDIDGPSDFTQNMELWMRGGPTTQQHRNNNNTSTKSPPRVPILEEPPLDTSEWHPNGQSSTPGPAALPKLLQPTVEDHHSELVPGTQTQQPATDASQQKEAEHLRTIRALQQDLESARRSRDDAVELLKTCRADMSEQRDLHDSEVERLRLELQQTRADELAITDLDRRLDRANGEIDRLKAESRQKDAVTSTLRQELQTTRDSHSDQLSRTSTDHLRAVELATSLQRQIQDLRQQLREAQAARAESPAPIPSTSPPPIPTNLPTPPSNTEFNEALLERDAADDALEASRAETASLRTELDSLRTEAASLRTELADRGAVDAALDSRVTDALRRRECAWKERLAAAEEERELLAKALMHGWGREEVGRGRPQGFAYRYLDGKSGEGERIDSGS